MSWHSRNGTGVDRLGCRYRISYPADWLERARVTRRLPSGRQSTKTLFRSPGQGPEAGPGALVRVAIESPQAESGRQGHRLRGERLHGRNRAPMG